MEAAIEKPLHILFGTVFLCALVSFFLQIPHEHPHRKGTVRSRAFLGGGGWKTPFHEKHTKTQLLNDYLIMSVNSHVHPCHDYMSLEGVNRFQVRLMQMLHSVMSCVACRGWAS